MLVYADTIITLVLPTILISVLLVIIVYNGIHMLHRRRVKASMQDPVIRYFNKKKLISPLTKVTKMLFVVSLTFFILNVPSHVIRIRLLIGSFIKGETIRPFRQISKS